MAESFGIILDRISAKCTLFTLLLFSFYAGIAQPYHKQFVSVSGSNNLSNVVYVSGDDSAITVVGDKGIINFNANTGAITGAKAIDTSSVGFSIAGVYEHGDMLYMAGIRGFSQDTTIVLKYNKNSGAVIWYKKIQSLAAIIRATAITGDDAGNLYMLCGSRVSISDNQNMAIIKLDTSGALVWAKGIGVDAMDEYPQNIHFAGDRELYVTGTGYLTMYGRPVTIRLNSNGAILNTNSIESSIGPRLGGGQSCIANGNIYLVDKTVVGPSDPGPVLVRVLDSNLATRHELIYSGMSPSSITTNGTSVLISGQALVASALPGFRSVRMDTALNVTGAAYFNNIPTSSIAVSAYGYINAADESIHFFNKSANDTINIIKTDATERVYCNDTTYNPFTTSFSYADSPYLYTESTLSISLSDVVTTISDMNIISIHRCPFPAGIPQLQQSKDLVLYPNPATTKINLQIPDIQKADVTIQNMLGQTVMSTNKVIDIDVSALANGFYMVQVWVNGNILIGKFCKM